MMSGGHSLMQRIDNSIRCSSRHVFRTEAAYLPIVRIINKMSVCLYVVPLHVHWHIGHWHDKLGVVKHVSSLYEIKKIQAGKTYGFGLDFRTSFMFLSNNDELKTDINSYWKTISLHCKTSRLHDKNLMTYQVRQNDPGTLQVRNNERRIGAYASTSKANVVLTMTFRRQHHHH